MSTPTPPPPPPPPPTPPPLVDLSGHYTVDPRFDRSFVGVGAVTLTNSSPLHADSDSEWAKGKNADSGSESARNSEPEPSRNSEREPNSSRLSTSAREIRIDSAAQEPREAELAFPSGQPFSDDNDSDPMDIE